MPICINRDPCGSHPLSDCQPWRSGAGLLLPGKTQSTAVCACHSRQLQISKRNGGYIFGLLLVRFIILETMAQVPVGGAVLCGRRLLRDPYIFPG